MLLKLTITVLLWLACMTVAQARALPLRLGEFRCEDGNHKLVVLSVRPYPGKPEKLILNWTGRDRILHAVSTQTGAIRYEGSTSKLVYLQIPSKSLLLDNRLMRGVLNECVWQKGSRSVTPYSVIMNGGFK